MLKETWYIDQVAVREVGKIDMLQVEELVPDNWNVVDATE